MRKALAYGLALLGLFTSLSAAAQGAEAWAVFEYRLLLAEQPERPRVSLRINSDNRFAQLSGGLDLTFLRVGPLVELRPWLLLAAHGTAISDKLGSGAHSTEYRLELEPTLQGRRGDLTWLDRNRVEYRFGDKERLRYRNLLRVNYAPKGARWLPFVWNEVMLEQDLEVEGGADEGLNQNRLSAGVGYVIREGTRFDVGYLRRSKKAGGEWLGDNVLWTSLLVALPSRASQAPPSSPPKSQPSLTPTSQPESQPESQPTSTPTSTPTSAP
jgi:Protein of unknown function (DUF2490)